MKNTEKLKKDPLESSNKKRELQNTILKKLVKDLNHKKEEIKKGKTKLSITIIFFFMSLITFAQINFTESFETDVFPPNNWTIEGHSENWAYAFTNYGGGFAGEPLLQTAPVFDDTTRLISPLINTLNASNLSLYFTHTMRLYQAGFVVGIAVRENGGVWVSQWEMDGTTTIEQEVDIMLENSNFQNFQFCFYFIGNSGKLRYWAMDEVHLYEKKDADIEAKNILLDTYYDASATIHPKARIYNNGLSTSSFDVLLAIYDTNSNVLFNTSQTIENLEVGAYQEVEFDNFTLPEMIDQAYRVEVNTALVDDQNSSNDHNEKYIYTYTQVHEMVVLELGTATWCSACPYAADAADSLVKNDYNVAVIEYHSNDDYSDENTDYRTLLYYTIYGFPTAYFDGGEEQVGAGPYFYNNYFTHYYFKSIEKTALSVNLYSGKKKAGNYLVKLGVSKIAPAYNKNCSVHLILTESNIPEEWQDEDELDYVCRKMFPDKNGEPINFTEIDEANYEYEIELDDDWNYDELELVAFVQDNETREILNATKANFAQLIGIEEEIVTNHYVSIFPNPFSEKLSISCSLEDDSFISIELIDINGIIVFKKNLNKLAKGKQQIELEATHSLDKGVYFLKVITNNSVQINKIIKQ